MLACIQLVYTTSAGIMESTVARFVKDQIRNITFTELYPLWNIRFHINAHYTDGSKKS